MNKILLLMTSMALILVSSSALAAKDEGFPGRAEFPKVPVYELEKLNDKFRDVVIVDSRSVLEYETLRIVNAVNIPVASKQFEAQVQELRKKTNKPIVFYCNGRTCYKSYISVKKAKAVGVDEVYAYDAGIFEWAKAYPKKAMLLGQSPVDVNKLIAKKDFKSHLLHHDKFSEDIADKSDTMVLDVRDKFQRAGVGFYPGKERWVSLDDKKKLEKYLAKAKEKKQTLYIYDEVGKQVRWLQYTIEGMGIKDYYFMQKGAKGYWQSIAINKQQ